MSNMSAVQKISLSSLSKKSRKINSEIHIGKDILDLVTNAMYVEPLSIFREYVQNAADAIDEGKVERLYTNKKKPKIEITINESERNIKIRDNGIGIKNSKFVNIISAFGGSHKRGTKLRGFRGVGRLSGLGYAQKLTFRSRSLKDKKIYEITWDGRKLKKYLQNNDVSDDLNDVVKEITDVSTYSADGWPEHFFEVELSKVIRYKNDVLLNEFEIINYLSQLAPVPFSPDFSFKTDIEKFLKDYNVDQTFNIYINDNEEPLYRPHLDYFYLKEEQIDEFTHLELFELEGINGDIDAIGWRLEHGYHGAIPSKEGISGIRLRSGNIQVGNSDILANSFPESRFNSWAVSEVHIISDKILPNGRRDNFEQNSHFENLEDQIIFHLNEITKICRRNSAVRNRIKTVHFELDKANDMIDIIKQNSRSKNAVKQIENQIKIKIVNLEKNIESNLIDEANKKKLTKKVEKIKNFINIPSSHNISNHLDFKSKQKQNIYKEVFDLIYDCSPNHTVAKGLIDKILKRLEKEFQ